ncbi:cell wall-binding repeat-containing protein [Peptacetobacter hiranonis]|uniref:cell wall-binding repeat-containing protein n=1 Tax=Peptacetobacter hiranonis TaxID=89152 RepID=UPI002E776956|nr:cell wall-binding repeat-containing protein [Peptacetobacter hiranonis]MEE0248070.1 cell wall-binding repeat-containing protein [Peptacetobacter hiranonis]
MKTPKHLATAMAVAMVATSVAPVMAATTTSNEEIIGKNRTETAVKISQDGWKKAETVILVNDSAIPDALTATPLAYAKNAPILLTGKDGLSKETADEIKRLAAKDVIMIGGDAVLTSKVEEGLKALKLKVDRIKGSTREETALAIAKRLDGIKDVSEIAVVNGVTGLADAVSVAAAAAEKGMPILLANPKSGLTLVEKFIKDESIKSSFIIGGDKVVSNEIAKNLPGKQRIEGANRNETNAKVIEKFYADRELDNLYVAKDGMENSGHLIDALAVGSLAAKNGAPVLIASKKLNEKQINVINTKKISTITQVGGNGNEKAFDELKEIEKSETIKVKNEAELQEALKKANANDVIEIESSASISKDVTLSTNNAVEINVKGDLKGEVTVKAPNADIKNSGTIGTLVVENGKNTTVTNASGGKIDKVEVSSSSENVKVENKGTITQVENNATGTTIENNGTISKPVTGTEKPSVEGNKPGGSTSGGGGGSVIVDGPEVARVSTEEELKAALENEEKTTIKLNNNITIKNRIHVKKSITIDLNNYELKCTELLNTEGNHSDGNPITDKNPKWGYAILITKDREGGENSQINVNVINGNLKFGASQEKQLNVGIGILGSNVDLTVSDVNVDMGGFTYKNAPDVAFGSMYGIATNGTYKNIKIDVKNGTKINNTILGMYLPSDKTDVTLTNTEINAGTGISIKGGILNIIDSKITATDDYGAPGAIDDYINGLKENNSGSEAAGEAIYLEGNYHWDAIVNISGNSELESKHGYALRTHFLREQATSGEHSGEALKKEININGATVKAGKDKVIFKNHKTYESFPNDAINSLNSIKITAGKYTDDVTKYLESGYKCTELNGMYTVVEDDAVSTIK